MKNYTVELAICPRCGAVCVNGHDDDGHIYCAKCRQTYVPKELKTISGKEFEEMRAKVRGGNGVKYECGGWEAYVID